MDIQATPRGIGTLWKYILPGRDANGAEGVDYLLGEQAVVNHAVQRKCYDVRLNYQLSN